MLGTPSSIARRTRIDAPIRYLHAGMKTDTLSTVMSESNDPQDQQYHEYDEQKLSTGIPPTLWTNHTSLYPGSVSGSEVTTGFPLFSRRPSIKLEADIKACENYKKRGKVVTDVFAKFADVTSIQGIPFFNKAEKSLAKIIWALICLGAFTMAILHSASVILSFLEYDTNSQVTISNNHLDFPSITFCNLNPVQRNKINEFNLSEWKNILEHIKPKEEYGIDLDELDDNSNLLTSTQSIQNPEDNNRNTRTKDGKGSQFKSLNQHLDTSKFSHIDIHDSLDLIENEDVPATLKISALLREVMARTNRTVREQITHSLNYTLIECSYDGKLCDTRNFSSRIDNDYGMCWTFNSRDIKEKALDSKKSGTNNGLTMTLFIQEDNYIDILNQGKGIRMEIHPFNTLPFVAESGISVPPGTHTYIGVRMKNQTRLGGKYGQCDDNEQYQDYYNGYNYTLRGCRSTCLDRKIGEKCGCYRETYAHLYNENHRQTLPICNMNKDGNCTSRQISLHHNEGLDCNCQQACNTVDYELQISNDVWPSEKYWWTLVDSVCDKNKQKCRDLRNIPAINRKQFLLENFLHVKIYFRDLNVENIQEVAAYELVQFVSDLGGAIGLWIGASIISLLELGDLLIKLFNFCKRKKIYKKREQELMYDKLTQSQPIISDSLGKKLNSYDPHSGSGISIYLPPKSNEAFPPSIDLRCTAPSIDDFF